MNPTPPQRTWRNCQEWKEKPLIRRIMADAHLGNYLIKNFPRHTETILCPECNSVEIATVEHLWPFNSYVHICSKCKYVIMESEWEKMDE